jgi:DNA-binding response OmpR family regulator
MKVQTDVPRLKEKHRASAQPDEWRECPITEPPRILVVEDDPSMAEFIGALLRRNWFNSVVRFSGVQGIQEFISAPVDLIITDLRMQTGDGIALIEAIRRISQTPVIIVTGFASEYADRVRFLNNVAMVSKPFDSRVLVELIDKALDICNSGSREGWNAWPDNGDHI